MKKPVRFAVLTAVAFGLIAGISLNAQAQNPMTKTTNAQKGGAAECKLNTTEKNFLEHMNQINMLEEKLGSLAQTKAESNEVKSYGQRMQTDHGQNEDQLKSLCQSKNLQYPGDLNATNKASFDKLSKLSGAEFDHAYIKAMVKGHTQALQLARTAERTSKEADIKDYAKKSVDAISQHLKLAQETEKKIASEKPAGKKTTAGQAGRHY